MTDQRIYKIYNYMNNAEPKDFTIPPFDTNYDVLGLYKNRIFEKGELKEVEYYGDYNPMTQQYSDKVVCEHRIYYRINEMVHRREMMIHWIYDDGTTGATKTTTKYYTPEESIVAGERRRGKVIATLKTNVVGLIMATEGMNQQDAETLGKPFLSTYSNEIAQYISGYEAELKNVVLTSTSFSWLDNPIDANGTLVRHYMFDGINIDYTVNNVYM
jgi:hypothetical protein